MKCFNSGIPARIEAQRLHSSPDRESGGEAHDTQSSFTSHTFFFVVFFSRFISIVRRVHQWCPCSPLEQLHLWKGLRTFFLLRGGCLPPSAQVSLGSAPRWWW